MLSVVAIAQTARKACAQPSFSTQLEEAFENIEVQGATVLVDFGATSRAAVIDGEASRTGSMPMAAWDAYQNDLDPSYAFKLNS